MSSFRAHNICIDSGSDLVDGPRCIKDKGRTRRPASANAGTNKIYPAQLVLRIEVARGNHKQKQASEPHPRIPGSAETRYRGEYNDSTASCPHRDRRLRFAFPQKSGRSLRAEHSREIRLHGSTLSKGAQGKQAAVWPAHEGPSRWRPTPPHPTTPRRRAKYIYIIPKRAFFWPTVTENDNENRTHYSLKFSFSLPVHFPSVLALRCRVYLRVG